jgi:thiazole/oxazole-forming peptide maturase SagD family component
VVRRPQCEACGDCSSTNRRPTVVNEFNGNAAKELDSFRIDDLEAIFEKIAHQISPLTGLISSVDRIDLPHPEVIHVFSAGVVAVSAEPASGADLDRSRFVYASGKGSTEQQARLSAIGEAVERYALAFQGYEITRIASLADFREAAIHPNALMNFSAQQLGAGEKKQRSPTPAILPPEENIHWTPLVSMHSGNPVWLPTSLCYFRTPYQEDARYTVFDSNGVAAGASLREAAVNGILEVIERDAVGIWWYNMPLLPCTVLEHVNDNYIDGMIKAYRGMGFSLVSYEVTSDVNIPVFVSSAVDAQENSNHSMQFGFGCGFSRLTALKRSLTELNQKLPTLLRRTCDEPNFEKKTPSFLTQFVHHCREDQTSNADGEPKSIECALQRLLDVVSAKGMEVLLLDLSRPDVEMAVARAVIVGMRQIYPRFAPGRMYEVPVKLGWRLRPPTEAQLNPTDLRV